MRITPFTVNPLAENCYVVSDETREAVIIDCGALYADEQDAIADYIARERLTPVAHLLTHAHFDHIFGAGFLYERYGLAPRCHAADLPLLTDIEGQMRDLLGHTFTGLTPYPAGEPLSGSSIPFGSHELTVLPCPGHTPGGVCFYCAAEHVLFSGDSLFRQSIGRTDFPGGDHWTLIARLKALIKRLPADTIVYPGHGPTTTIGAEHQSNPYLFG